MRLRRETGDFEIVLTSENEYKSKLNKRVSAEDLIGQVAKVDGRFFIISEAQDAVDKTTVSVKIGENNYIYTRETAILAKVVG